MNRNYRRKKKIIKPELQWRLMTVFAVLAVSSTILQAIALGTTLVIIAQELPNDGRLLQGKIETVVWVGLAATSLFVLPLHLVVGRSLTFKVAGPLYRFETYLRQLIAGERPGPCRIRQDDELQEFCQLLNEAVAPLSTPLAEPKEESEAGDAAGDDGQEEGPRSALPAEPAREPTVPAE